MAKRIQDDLNQMVRAHTNLCVFDASFATLESGALYGGVGSEKAKEKIEKIVRREQQRLLDIYDKSKAKVLAASKEGGAV